MAKKEKKQKIKYIDDGSTIADMSGVGKNASKTPKPDQKGKKKSAPAPRATFKEMFRTYTDSVKLMFFPMLVVLGILAIAFLLVYLIL